MYNKHQIHSLSPTYLRAYRLARNEPTILDIPAMRDRPSISKVVAEKLIQEVIIDEKLRFNSTVLQRLCKEAYLRPVTITSHRMNPPDLIHLFHHVQDLLIIFTTLQKSLS